MGDVIRFPVRPKPRAVAYDPFQREREALLRVPFGPKDDDRRPADTEPEDVA